MEKKIAGKSGELLAQGLKLENGLEVTRSAHCPLGIYQGIERKRPNFQPGNPDRLTQRQALLVAAQPLDFVKTVELPPIRSKIKVF